MRATSPTMMAYVCHLQKLRERSQISQETVGEALGCTRSYVSMFETGRRHLRMDQVVKLLPLFDCTLEELIEIVPTD